MRQECTDGSGKSPNKRKNHWGMPGAARWVPGLTFLFDRLYWRPSGTALWLLDDAMLVVGGRMRGLRIGEKGSNICKWHLNLGPDGPEGSPEASGMAQWTALGRASQPWPREGPDPALHPEFDPPNKKARKV